MPKESDFVYELVKFYNKFSYTFFHRTHGGIYNSIAGLPDILGCFHGRFVGVECKHFPLPKKDSTTLNLQGSLTLKQLDILNKIDLADGVSRIAFLIKNEDYIQWFTLEELRICEYNAGQFRQKIKENPAHFNQKDPFPTINSWKLLKKLNKNMGFPPQ